MRWHFLTTPPSDGAGNMALDDALMVRAARTGDAVMRVYGWSSPTLSLGRNQRARGCYDLEGAAAMGVGFVRRPTGGRALLHHHEVTYSVTAPLGETRARAMYDFINDLLLDAVRRLGVNAGRAQASAAVAPGLRPCFDIPSEHEIVVGERKLVGSAQWRRNGSLLQHGSILIRDDQPLIARLVLGSSGDATSAATLGEAIGREPALDEVAEVLRRALGAATSADPEPLPDFSDVMDDTYRLRHLYGSSEWTWRR